ncbi:multi-sensor signal transduction histidine kinase [Pseudodesulfovibrio mercurii]|uniref:histidine kinase n=1 Tax=Pseudodesulfovibrio mercurii TaxID=641491 RepID=F0JDN6_9BACT|nr:ATP-binding protein [Pseudodesulfovibrio mercurii]EGB14568.1 multi-sensor signal transduction histidine kinase [Pseudodesulfovibrio mercurii]
MRRAVLILILCLGFLPVLAHGRALARPVYHVGTRALSPPFSFLAVKEGKQGVRGYSVDEMVMLGRIMGADMEFRPIHDLGKRRELFLNGSVDILAHDSQETADELDAIWIPVGISLRHHLYVNESCRSVTCLRDLASKKVVAITSAPYSAEINLPEDVVWLSSPMEALNMVSQGVMDVFVAPSERVADDLIDRYQIPNILKKGVVLGESPLGIIVPRSRPALAEDIREAFRHLRESGMAAQLRDKWFGKPTITDDLRHYAKYVAVGSGVAGVIFVAIVVWNVSLKRRVDRVTQDLRRTEQRYRDLIESSPDMIFLVNEEGSVLHANERARDSLRFPGPVNEVNLRQLVTREYADEIDAFLKKVFNDGCDKFEFQMVESAGHPMEVEVAGRIIQGPVRTQLLACLFARNVTERNRMEEELIQSERLGIIGKMAASLAHEINNPLGVIQANAEDLMFEEGLVPDVKDGLLAIQRNAIRAGEITKGLLEAATPKPMSMETVEIGALVRDALSLLGSRRKQERVEVDLPDEPLYIRGDDRALQQVLMNLVFNSLAVTGEDERILIRACRAGEGEDETVRLEVSDNGTGIERHNLTQIFEPFFSSRKGGFGLGLFITRRMVERHDGLIFAESEPGRGTCMFLEFPSVHDEEA